MSRYVLRYLGTNDPSSQEESRLMSALKNVEVIDRMPGTVLVEAREAELRSVVEKFKQWSYSPDVNVPLNPPRKRVLHPL